MNKETNGLLERMSRQKDIVQNHRHIIMILYKTYSYQKSIAMQKEKNGSLERVSRQKDNVQNHSKSFQLVLASFQALIEVEDPVRHEFELIKAARSHKIPVSSYRKMYRAWQKQQENGYEPS